MSSKLCGRMRRRRSGKTAHNPSTQRERYSTVNVTMIEIRSCEGMDEFEACVQLQIEIWGYDEGDVIPRKTFLLATKMSHTFDVVDLTPFATVIGKLNFNSVG